MNRILVVNVNWLGDVIFSSTVFKVLRAQYPSAHIACLAVPRVKAVLESIPFIDEIIVYDEKGAHWNPFAKIGLMLKLRRSHFDVAFLLHRSLTRALLVYFAAIKERVGYDEKGRGKFLTHKVKPLDGVVHRSDHYLNVIESFGVAVEDRTTECRANLTALKYMELIFEEHNIEESDYVVVINPGGNWDLKRWSKKNFTRLIEDLMKDPTIKVIVSGAEKDIELVEEIVAPLSKKPIVLTGDMSLGQLIALLAKADLLVSADSGPLHLANSVGTDVIGLFGPTRPEITGLRGSGKHKILQYDVGCNRKACYYLKCPDNICMQSITVENVCDAVRQIKNK